MEKKISVQYSHPYPIDLDLDKYELRFWADGNCMDAPDAPIRIKNGQGLKVHELECDDGVFHIYRHIEEMEGKVCCFIYRARGKRFSMVKEFVGIDEVTGCIRLAFYNPKKTDVYLKIDAIEKVFVVDGVTD